MEIVFGMEKWRLCLGWRNGDCIWNGEMEIVFKMEKWRLCLRWRNGDCV